MAEKTGVREVVEPMTRDMGLKSSKSRGDAVLSPPELSIQAVRNGYGIVAVRLFNTGETVCEIRGRVVTVATVWRYWRLNPRRGENCFRFDEEHYLDPEGYVGTYANHSCFPNAGIRKSRGKLWLIALRRIDAGEEVTHDYSTLLGVDDVWTMKCNCGESGCRRIVANVTTISHESYENYVNLGVIPAFILKTFSIQKKFAKRNN